jgi:hypothetical protein
LLLLDLDLLPASPAPQQQLGHALSLRLSFSRRERDCGGLLLQRGLGARGRVLWRRGGVEGGGELDLFRLSLLLLLLLADVLRRRSQRKLEQMREFGKR